MPRCVAEDAPDVVPNTFVNVVLLAPHCVNHARNATVTTKKKEPITKNAMADLKRSVFLFL